MLTYDVDLDALDHIPKNCMFTVSLAHKGVWYVAAAVPMPAFMGLVTYGLCLRKGTTIPDNYNNETAPGLVLFCVEDGPEDRNDLVPGTLATYEQAREILTIIRAGDTDLADTVLADGHPEVVAEFTERMRQTGAGPDQRFTPVPAPPTESIKVRSA